MLPLQRPHIILRFRAKARQRSADRIGDVRRGKVAVVLFDHARIAMTKRSFLGANGLLLPPDPARYDSPRDARAHVSEHAAGV